MLKKCPKKFQMSEQNWGCLDKMSKVNFSPAETLRYMKSKIIKRVALNSGRYDGFLFYVII